MLFLEMSTPAFVPCELSHLKLDWLDDCVDFDQIAFSTLLQKFMLTFAGRTKVYRDADSAANQALIL